MLDVTSDKLPLFFHEAAPGAHEYLGYLPDVEPGNAMGAGHVA